MGKQIIYLYKSGHKGYAIASDGTCLAVERGRDTDALQRALGFKGHKHHSDYAKHYPLTGFQLEWVSYPDRNEGFRAAYAKNQEMPVRR